MLFTTWPSSIPATTQVRKDVNISPEGLIQVLHFCSKVRAPTPSELRRADVWPSWFHKKAKACKYEPNNKAFLIVSLIYCIKAMDIKYGVRIPYTWDLLQNYTLKYCWLIINRLRFRLTRRNKPTVSKSLKRGQGSADRRRISRHPAIVGYPEGAQVLRVARYVPPHRRPRTEGMTCSDCGSTLRRYNRQLFQDYRGPGLLSEYWSRHRDLLTGRSRPDYTPHERNVASAISRQLVCNCNMPDDTDPFSGRYYVPQRPVEDDDDYFSSLAMDLGL